MEDRGVLNIDPMRDVHRQLLSCLILALILSLGCRALHDPAQNPMAGWKLSWSQDRSKLPREILDDYERYVQSLSPTDRSHVGPVELLEDGTGQRAIVIL